MGETVGKNGGAVEARPALDDYLWDMGARRDADVATLLAMAKAVLHLGDDDGPSARQRMQSVLDGAGQDERDAREGRDALEEHDAQGRGPAHWWLRHGEAKIDFTGDQFGGPGALIELEPGRDADAARRVGEALRPRMAGPAGDRFDCAVAAGVMLAAEGVPTRLCRGTVGPGGRYREESVHGVDFKSLAGLLGLLG